MSHFPLLDASILTDYTISDHHPVVAVFQCPSPNLLSQPPLPPCIFRKLSSDEKQQFSNSIRLISDWCRNSRTHLPGPHWKRSSPPLILSFCRLGLRTTKSRVQNRSARTRMATASSGNNYAHPRLLLPQHFPSTLRKFSPW